MNIFASNPAYLSALALVCGSVVGALGSALSAVIAQKHQDRRDLVARKITQREELYSDFISEGARLMVDAAQNSFEDPSKLVPIYALVGRIRLRSSGTVVETAERFTEAILGFYEQPNLTAEEIRSAVIERGDPLREFSNVCRRELESLWQGR